MSDTDALKERIDVLLRETHSLRESLREFRYPTDKAVNRMRDTLARYRDRVVYWQLKFQTVKAENNALRRKMHRRERRDE